MEGLHFSSEINVVSLFTIAGAVVAVARYIWAATGAARHAEKTACEARSSAASAHDKIILLDKAFGLYREGVARDIPDKGEIRALEQRLIAANRESEERLSAMIHGLSERFDSVMTARL